MQAIVCITLRHLHFAYYFIRYCRQELLAFVSLMIRIMEIMIRVRIVKNKGGLYRFAPSSIRFRRDMKEVSILVVSQRLQIWFYNKAKRRFIKIDD